MSNFRVSTWGQSKCLWVLKHIDTGSVMAFDYGMPIFEKGSCKIHYFFEEYYSYDWEIILMIYITDGTFRPVMVCVGTLSNFNTNF